MKISICLAIILLPFVAFPEARNLAEPQSVTMREGTVPQFRGEWVPAKAVCSSPLKLVIEPTRVIFLKGTDRMEYPRLDQCFSCMGPAVENMVLLTTEAMGDSPFTIYLDGSKKKPSIKVEFSDKKLGARFPFGDGALKKCE